MSQRSRRHSPSSDTSSPPSTSASSPAFPAQPWPLVVHEPFEALAADPDLPLCAPYNKLLYHLFPADTNVLVAPGPYPPLPNTETDAISTPFVFTVFYKTHTVLLLHVHPAHGLRWASARMSADALCRRRLNDLAPDCRLPKLYALSTFGTKLRFYAATKVVTAVPTSPTGIPSAAISSRVARTISCPAVQIDPPLPPPVAGSDVAPPSRWNCDVLEEAGANLLKQSVAEIIARIYLTDGEHQMRFYSLLNADVRPSILNN
ncbi:unnamed protein product [Mycena citricolor]|uniref:Uncharacterized protein n=1 Tax=Mycena citricolor TaxID=2018698 RepID=A0AAD2H8C8_9AGAR|nr:unnamed protein product [Mycena citricolor]